MRSGRIIPAKHPYTALLDNYVGSPKRLYILGELPKTRRPSVAIVGSRQPTPYGHEVTYRLAFDLAKAGIVVISGLAYGIDAAAHKAALEAGGTTIAIMAAGLDTIYPRQHQALARQIIDSGGALVSEYPPGTTPYKVNFLARNRIVSGLADAVLVTEATTRSGTLATVAHALEQSKEIFAVPGNITSPLSASPNTLISKGAHLATSAEDILQIIAPQLVQEQTALPLGNNPAETAILQLLAQGVRHGDQLQQQSGLTISEFLQTLTLLEISGAIRALGGDQWTIS